MAQKKYKKRHHNSTVTAKKQAEAARIADEKDRNRKRMDPTARTLLLGDLVFLALVSMLDMAGMVPAPVSAICSLIGIDLFEHRCLEFVGDIFLPLCHVLFIEMVDHIFHR